MKPETKRLEMIILTGNIGCGKSLIASKLAKKGYVVINSDSITTMVQGGEYGLYDPDKKPVYHGMERVGIENSLSNGLSVVIDRTNMKVSDRARYIEIGKKYFAYIHSYDWGPGNDETLSRRLAKPNGIPASQWKDVHNFMAESYESPSLDEGFYSHNSGPKDFTFSAFDFDGTIVENKFPKIGKRIESTILKMTERWDNLRNIIIIWTCRSGDYLNEARAFLIKERIPFDFINENPMVNFGSPKVYAHEYFDDRNKRI